MPSIRQNNYSFDPEKYLEGLSPFGYEVMKCILSNWTSTSNGICDTTLTNLPSIDIVDTSVQKSLDTYKNGTNKENILSTYPQYCNSIDEDNLPLSMFNDEQENEMSSISSYKRFTSLVSTQVTSSPHILSPKEVDISTEIEPLLSKNCVSTFPFSNTNDDFPSSQNHSITNQNNSFHEMSLKKISESGKETSKNDTDRTRKNTDFKEILKQYAAPKKLNTEVSSNNLPTEDNVTINRETPNNHFAGASKSITVQHETSNMVTNLFQDLHNSEANIDIIENSQTIPVSQKLWILSNNTIGNKENINVPNAMVSDLKKTLLGRRVNEKLNTHKLHSNNKTSTKLTVEKNEKPKKKRLNQLKLSEMLPAKKSKNIEEPKNIVKKSRKKQVEMVSDITSPKISRKVNKDFNRWLNSLNNSTDTKFTSDFNFVSKEKIKEGIEITDEISIPKDITEQKNIKQPVVSKIQTVIASHEGKMKFKKMEEVVDESLPTNQTKKKCKFVPPTKNETTKMKVDYLIENMDQELISTIQNILLTETPVEIGMAILFKEGFCQLSKVSGSLDTTCSPKALVLRFMWTDKQRFFCMSIRGNSPTEKQMRK